MQLGGLFGSTVEPAPNTTALRTGGMGGGGATVPTSVSSDSNGRGLHELKVWGLSDRGRGVAKGRAISSCHMLSQIFDKHHALGLMPPGERHMSLYWLKTTWQVFNTSLDRKHPLRCSPPLMIWILIFL